MKPSDAIGIIKGLIKTVEISYKSSPLLDKPPYPAVEALTLAISALEKQEQDRWRPFKCREATEDDYTSYDYIMECELPEDGQTVLVTIQTKGHEPVQVDTYYGGDGEECALDSGYVLCEQAIAWRPLPQPYEAEEDNE